MLIDKRPLGNIWMNDNAQRRPSALRQSTAWCHVMLFTPIALSQNSLRFNNRTFYLLSVLQVQQSRSANVSSILVGMRFINQYSVAGSQLIRNFINKQCEVSVCANLCLGYSSCTAFNSRRLWPGNCVCELIAQVANYDQLQVQNEIGSTHWEIKWTTTNVSVFSSTSRRFLCVSSRSSLSSFNSILVCTLLLIYACLWNKL